MPRLTGKVAFITGAGSGISRCLEGAAIDFAAREWASAAPAQHKSSPDSPLEDAVSSELVSGPPSSEEFQSGYGELWCLIKQFRAEKFSIEK